MEGCPRMLTWGDGGMEGIPPSLPTSMVDCIGRETGIDKNQDLHKCEPDLKTTDRALSAQQRPKQEKSSKTEKEIQTIGALLGLQGTVLEARVSPSKHPLRLYEKLS